VYSIAESYPFYLNKNALKEFLDGNKDFYNYRDALQLNKDSLMYFHAYRDFVVDQMYNIVFTKYPNEKIYNEDFTTTLLNIIDEKITAEKPKNKFLKQTIISYFHKNATSKIDKKPFEVFFQLSSNIDEKKQVECLLNDFKILRDGSRLVNFQLVDFNNTVHESKKLFRGKKTLIYFWNSTYVTKEYVSSKIKYFTAKYPEIEYIGVKIDGNSNDYIDQLDIKTQFFITQKSKANDFLTSKMPRTILINKKGIIKHHYTSLSSKNIYTQLEALAKN
jgi:peroxiredoxin